MAGYTNRPVRPKKVAAYVNAKYLDKVDLAALNLEPCGVGLGPDCLEQVGPLTLPDTLNLALGGPAAFPNGRRVAEPVMDIILAALLLEVGPPPFDGGTESITRFLDLNNDKTLGDSLNPFTNDVPFPDAWPYLAPAHEPM